MKNEINSHNPEQFGLLANAIVRFNNDSNLYTFDHQSLSVVNEGYRFNHFVEEPKKNGIGEIELNLTSEYKLNAGGAIVNVTPISNIPVVATVYTSGKGVLINLFDLSGNRVDSGFSLMAIMPVGH